MKIFFALALSTAVFAADEFSYPEIIIEEASPQFETEELAFEEAPIEIEATNSLEGVIEKETAAVLKTEVEEKIPEALEPVYEDLAHLAEKPNFTEAEIPASKSVYESLPITEEEKEKIGNIFITMSENNVFQLLFERKYLQRLGKEINHVHPMRFLGTAFSDRRITHAIRSIKGSMFKWDGFIDGFSERLNEEYMANNINQYVEGLAETLRVDKARMQAFIDKKDFEGLVIYLMNNVRPGAQ